MKRLASVELRDLTKRFGPVTVVDNVALRIDHGQLVCLLGPSGCGKTTTLRLIAGFLEPTAAKSVSATAWYRQRRARCRPNSARCR